MTIRDLEMVRVSCLGRLGPQYHPSALTTGTQEGSEVRGKKVGSGLWRWGRARSQGTQAPLEAGKGREAGSPREPREGASAAHT